MKLLSKLTLILLMVFACTGLAIAKKQENDTIIDCEFAESELTIDQIAPGPYRGESGSKRAPGFKVTYNVSKNCYGGGKWQVSPTEYYCGWDGDDHEVRINRFNGSATNKSYVLDDGKKFPFIHKGQCKKVDKPIM